MEYVKRMFDKASIQGLADYFLYGQGPEKEKRDYDTRMKDAFEAFEKVVEQCTGERQGAIVDAANELVEEATHVYMEIGMELGLLLVEDAIHNVKKEK